LILPKNQMIQPESQIHKVKKPQTITRILTTTTLT
jgi:hypothetical protein